MRWVMYTSSEGDRAGLVVDGQIHGLAAGSRVVDLLGDDGERMATAAEEARSNPTEVVPFDGATIGPPVQPQQIRDFLTFLDHLRAALGGVDTKLPEVWSQIPAFYFSNTSGTLGPNDPVTMAPGTEWWDYELEVAAIIGREGSDLDPDTAEEIVAGFTILCDWSARDVQLHEMKLNLGPAKGKDTANTVGPALVTKDELEPFRSGHSYKLAMKGYVNDELISEGSMDQMDWSWGEIVAYASRGTTLYPGEVIGSGTVPTGCLLEHFSTKGPDEFPGWLKPGDVVRLEVEQLGATRQEVLPAKPVHRLRTGH